MYIYIHAMFFVAFFLYDFDYLIDLISHIASFLIFNLVLGHSVCTGKIPCRVLAVALWKTRRVAGKFWPHCTARIMRCPYCENHLCLKNFLKPSPIIGNQTCKSWNQYWNSSATNPLTRNCNWSSSFKVLDSLLSSFSSSSPVAV